MRRRRRVSPARLSPASSRLLSLLPPAFFPTPLTPPAGELNHLHAAFLTARGISHGINLRKMPSMQYLYYICQIGLALAPLSNNALFLQVKPNPKYPDHQIPYYPTTSIP